MIMMDTTGKCWKSGQLALVYRKLLPLSFWMIQLLCCIHSAFLRKPSLCREEIRLISNRSNIWYPSGRIDLRSKPNLFLRSSWAKSLRWPILFLLSSKIFWMCSGQWKMVLLSLISSSEKIAVISSIKLVSRHNSREILPQVYRPQQCRLLVFVRNDMRSR
jgi:hypothetical protein